MSTWYKVAWIQPLFDACNTVAPGRGHAEDGTIGDLAHASGVSGHNPDDTPGVQAERQDADSKPEVRAADVDSTGAWPAGLSMETVVQAVLAACRAGVERRLIYIIFNRRIWRASNGWREERYTGSDPHDRHAHFSGDPAYDEAGDAWASILNLKGGTMADDHALNAETYLWRRTIMSPKVVGIQFNGGLVDVDNVEGMTIQRIEAKLDAVLRAQGVAQADIDELQARPVLDVAALAAALAPLIDAQVDSTVSVEAVRAALEQVLPGVHLTLPPAAA